MFLKCGKCGYEWNYLGKSAFKATCPICSCNSKIYFFNKENLKYAKTVKCAHCKKTVVKHRSQIKYCSVRCAAMAAYPLGVAASAKLTRAITTEGPMSELIV
jgi:Zn ribbon nucleic-acid-binding protein